MLGYLISAVSGVIGFFSKSKPPPEEISTAFIAGGTMLSMLFWLFFVAVLIKVFNSAFKETEQQDPVEPVKKMIVKQQQKQNNNFKADRI